MPAIKLEQFGGMLPAWDDHLLPAGQASSSLNGYLFGGAIQGWRKPKLLRSLTNPLAKYAYRIPTIPPGLEPQFRNNILEGSTWLEFLDQDTNVVKSQVTQDTFGRFYAASPSQTPQYNTTARIVAGKPFFQLGVPAPGCAPGIEVIGGGNTSILPSNHNTGNGVTYTLLANTMYLVPFVPTGATQLQDVQLAISSANNAATGRFAAAVYEDATVGSSTPTFPGKLLATGQIEVGPQPGNILSPFTNPPPLQQFVPYWLGIFADTDLVVQGQLDGGTNSYSFLNTFTNGPELIAPTGLANQPDLLMFGDGQTSDVLEARSYCYTWVTAYGEEGPPSPTTLANGWSNGAWNINLFCPEANNQGVDRNLAIIRLYRTVPGQSGQTQFFFVADISIGSSDPDAVAAVNNDPLTCLPPQSVYVDTVLDDVISLNLILPSATWFPPPTDLQSLLNLPNGMVVGFRANEIWFCEPYRPHAWPPGYVLTLDFPIVGMGMTMGAAVAATSANAYLVGGTSPTVMSLQKCAPPQPCLSRASVLSSDQGVYYMSPNGLIMVTPSGQCINTTETWITREKWQALAPQKYARCVPLVGEYLVFGSTFNGDLSTATQGFTIQLEQDNASFTIWPQPGGHRVGFNKMEAPNDTPIDNLLVDPWTGIVTVIQSGQIWYYDFTDQSPQIAPYTFRTKKFQQTTRRNFEAMKVYFTVPPGLPDPTTVARNEAPTADPSWNTLSPTQYGIVRVFADVDDGSGDGAMQLVCAREIRKSGELLRIPSGFKAETWQFEFTGRVIISNCQVATSVKELSHV